MSEKNIINSAKRSLEVAKQNFKPDAVDLIVNALAYDINDRRGLKNEWRQIDYEVIKEIKATWKEIILEGFKIGAS